MGVLLNALFGSNYGCDELLQGQFPTQGPGGITLQSDNAQKSRRASNSLTIPPYVVGALHIQGQCIPRYQHKPACTQVKLSMFRRDLQCV